jgi:ABC-type transport system substrate-binding protein
VYSWERELAPKTASPLTYLWVNLKGAAEYEGGKTKHISGLATPDRYTIRVSLVQKYPGFLYVFGIPCSMVVDPKVIEQFHAENSDFKTHAVGSGPFILKDWVQGQKVDFVRNPTYFKSGLPYVDGVHMDLGVTGDVGLLKLEKGQVDLLDNVIPPAQFPTVISDPVLKKQVVSLTDIGVYMIAMNVKVKPFTDIRVRQAVAYALSKVRAVRFMNGRAVPATGVLPPGLPGIGAKNIPDPFPYNPSKAKQLLAAAGFPNGFTTTMAVPTGSPNEARMADAAIYDLGQIGIKVNIKPVVTEGSAVAAIPMQAYHWLMDYPDPADFIDGFTSCASAVVGGSNVAFYCNPAVDTLANAARGMPTGPARVQAYLHIDQLVANDAMSVPMFYDIYYYIHSKRIQNFSVSPLWAPYSLDRYWLSS